MGLPPAQTPASVVPAGAVDAEKGAAAAATGEAGAAYSGEWIALEGTRTPDDSHSPAYRKIAARSDCSNCAATISQYQYP